MCFTLQKPFPPAVSLDSIPPSASEQPALSEDEVVELAFLLPDWQVSALEAMAHGRGLTTGQMLRHILGELFHRQTRFASSGWEG